MASPEDVVNVALGEVGYSRWNDPEAGTKYGRWYADMIGDSYYGESGVPYCAMFASWCLNQAGADCAGMPSAYCPDIVNAGHAAGTTPYNEDAQAGDLVLFDWGGDGVADHVGIVVENHPDGEYMDTVEGNTSDNSGGSQSNGGCVAQKQRPYSSICCIVRPYYSYGEEQEEPAYDPQPARTEVPYADGNSVYRCYNPNNGLHMFTTNHDEAQLMVDEGWTYEGIGWQAGGAENVYRLYNQYNGAHFFTASVTEVGQAVVNGWTYEGQAFCAGNVPVYRLFNVNNGDHVYTASSVERDSLAGAGWQDEGQL